MSDPNTNSSVTALREASRELHEAAEALEGGDRVACTAKILRALRVVYGVRQHVGAGAEAVAAEIGERVIDAAQDAFGAAIDSFFKPRPRR